MHLITKFCETKTERIEGEIGKSKIIVGYFNIILSVINRISRQKISKDIK